MKESGQIYLEDKTQITQMTNEQNNPTSTGSKQ